MLQVLINKNFKHNNKKIKNILTKIIKILICYQNQLLTQQVKI